MGFRHLWCFQVVFPDVASSRAPQRGGAGSLARGGRESCPGGGWSALCGPLGGSCHVDPGTPAWGNGESCPGGGRSVLYGPWGGSRPREPGTPAPGGGEPRSGGGRRVLWGPWGCRRRQEPGTPVWGEIRDQDVHHSVLKFGLVQLHVHCAYHLLEGYPPHAPYEARPPQGPLIDGHCNGVESGGVQLRYVGGDGYPPEVCLLDRLVRMFEEQGYPPSPAHRAAYRGATHHGAEGPLVRLRQVLVPSDINANVRLGQAEVRATCLARLHLPLRASALSSRRPASWVAMPWDASTSMGGGGRGASAARGAPAPRAGEVALGGSPGAGPGSRPCAKAGSAAASLASGGASRGGHWSHGLGRPKRQASHQSSVCSSGGLSSVRGAEVSAPSEAWGARG